MGTLPNLDDTICALSTPPGEGGIAVVRVSGPQALGLVRKLCSKLPSELKSHTVHLSLLHDPSSGRLVDEVLVTFFENGRSFTGQETVEISCHGGRVVSSYILQLLTSLGARPAERGEFSFRSFMNGNLDLVQAEGVLDLIHAKSFSATHVASRQLKGELSKKYEGLERDLLWTLAQIEASIDFSTEDIQPVETTQLLARLDTLTQALKELLGTYQKGKLLREGFRVALAGAPNAGKSSIFNKLLNEDRSIVTPIEGTTRDVVQGTMDVSGYPVILQDTAGLRESHDLVEQLGIQKAKVAMEDSDWVFMVIHAQDVLKNPSEIKYKGDYSKDRVLFLINQVDLLSEGQLVGLEESLDKMGLSRKDRVLVSAETGLGLDQVLNFLRSRVDLGENLDQEVYVNLRHFNSLAHILERVVQSRHLLEMGESPELVAFELQDGLRSVHGLLGKELFEQVIDKIFKEFCLGK